MRRLGPVGVITPTEGTFKRSDVERGVERYDAANPSLWRNPLFWVGAVMLGSSLLWLLIG